MEMPFEKIIDINETKELWKVAVKVHHKWTIISNKKEHIELIFVDADVSVKWVFQFNYILVMAKMKLMLRFICRAQMFM